MRMQPPALARSVFEPSPAERADDTLIERLRAESTTRVLQVRGDRARVRGDRLVWAAAADVVEQAPSAEWAFLGRASDGSARLVAASPAATADAGTDRDDEATWSSLRTSGGDLVDEDAGAFVTAVALGRWFADFGFCPRCGSPARLRSAGWSRQCTGCGREQFPRTDPAVIVAVRDTRDERLLLGQNASWAADGRFSTFAGFVEAGESLETAIRREVEEEAGVVVDDLEYRGSQAWPYPRSLMLGFHAVAADQPQARPDGEEIVAVRWFDRDEIRSALAGEGPVALPGSASIARRLIADWCGATA
ncbi:NAD(+) diphosphatase [Microbacterium sp. cf332]|uniref:NAD(+) diphosphatase n=1 Tax=Microbacterium sp. cf332 TaxID=1761804 RepID=UPI000882CF9F|nr:NAD(+) diphosphatase [Microbacterium sp. cf332]SDQ07127.1 NAD+ diphosphatase [Microbacterium sp. cf332]